MAVQTKTGTEHAEAPRPWIEIFRAGDYTGANKGVISRDDLNRVVASYDPTYHEAPITIGHPVDNKPAFGWIEALRADGDTLLAREKQVDPAFNDARQAGRSKNARRHSIAMRPAQSPGCGMSPTWARCRPR